MTIRIFTLPFDPESEEFPDEDLARFLVNKRVKQTRAEFFQADGRPYWTFFIEYTPVMGQERKADTSKLNETQQKLFEQLRQWRKETSDREGVPVFIIANNKQLTELVIQAPVTLLKTAIRLLSGALPISRICGAGMSGRGKTNDFKKA